MLGLIVVVVCLAGLVALQAIRVHRLEWEVRQLWLARGRDLERVKALEALVIDEDEAEERHRASQDKTRRLEALEAQILRLQEEQARQV